MGFNPLNTEAVFRAQWVKTHWRVEKESLSPPMDFNPLNTEAVFRAQWVKTHWRVKREFVSSNGFQPIEYRGSFSRSMG